MDETVNRNSEEFRTLIKLSQMATVAIGAVLSETKPMLYTERYFSGEDICRMFHISKRSLQNYRDANEIPYTKIGSKILYPESALLKLLDKNYNGVKDY